MWIRSQDKKRIFDMTGSNIEIAQGKNILGYDNTFSSGNVPTFLGKYPTEQRAIEVLDEICNAYISLNYQKGKECSATYGYFGAYVKNGVFQMPEV